VSGGIVLGHGGNTTVIKMTATWQEDSLRYAGCWHNWFSGILNEPGPGSKPYDLDVFSYANTSKIVILSRFVALSVSLIQKVSLFLQSSVTKIP